MGCDCSPKISFRCTYDIKNGNEIRIINDRSFVDDNREVINEEIKSKIKILNGLHKEELIFNKKFDKRGYITIDFIIEGKLTDMSFMFLDCYSLKKVEFIDIDTSLVDNMRLLFARCKELENLDLTLFDTSNVKNMFNMFFECEKLKEIKGINNFNTTNVNNMLQMFRDCYELNNLDLTNFNTSNVTNMEFMFKRNLKLKQIIGIKSFDTSKVIKMRNMFEGCFELEYLDLTNFNTSNATNLSCMFRYCKKIKEIKGINNFNTANVNNFHQMFWECKELESLDLTSFDTSNITNMKMMFYKCEKLKEIKGINNFNTSKVTTMSSMFESCNELEILDLSNFDTSNVWDMSKMFYECSKLKKIIGINNFNISKVTKYNDMFYGCNSELEKINFSNSDISADNIKINNNNDIKEKPIAVIFNSVNQDIHYAAICYESDNFTKVEEQLFNEYPQLKDQNIAYLFEGAMIDRNLTIKQNKIKNNSNIIINYID